MPTRYGTWDDLVRLILMKKYNAMHREVYPQEEFIS